jgi:serine/threonine-protein phosphatase 2A activator
MSCLSCKIPCCFLQTSLQLLPPELQGAAVELLPYLLDSFGNATRIDYGTGHETTFVAFLYCLAALGLVTEADRQALVCVVFNR